MVRFLGSEKEPKVKRNDQQCPLLTLLGDKELQNKRGKKPIFILTSVNSCLLNTKSSVDVMADLVRLCTDSVFPGSVLIK